MCDGLAPGKLSRVAHKTSGTQGDYHDKRLSQWEPMAAQQRWHRPWLSQIREFAQLGSVFNFSFVAYEFNFVALDFCI